MTSAKEVKNCKKEKLNYTIQLDFLDDDEKKEFISDLENKDDDFFHWNAIDNLLDILR